VQYRDYFDNHTPIFQMLSAPILKFFGERADILIPMRIAMIPLFAGMLWCTYRIAAALFSRRAGVWAAIFTALYPVFMLTSTEFRTDDMWVMGWMATVAVAVGMPLNWQRALVAGMLMGFTYGVSMKTSLLMASLLIAAGLVLILRAKEEGRQAVSAAVKNLFSFAIGVCVVPLALVVFFWSQGALKQFIYCAVEHNATPGLGNWSRQAYRQLIFPAAFPLLMAGGIAFYRSTASRETASRRATIFLTAAIFLAALESYWPLLTSQDFMPVVPLFATSLAPVALAVAERISQRYPVLKWYPGLAIPLVCAALEIGAMQKQANVFVDRAGDWNRSLANVLKLTDSGDYVMDGKGETIFRRRPCYWVLEGITLVRMRMGLIKNSVVDDVLKYKACVAMPTRLPGQALRWMKAHFVPVSERVYVAGAALKNVQPGELKKFEIAIPAYYQVVSSDGPVPGEIDGKSYSGRIYLDAGEHSFCYRDTGDLAVVWSQAVERGFSPFHLAPEFHATKDEL
jgi:hypothetical protein